MNVYTEVSDAKTLQALRRLAGWAGFEQPAGVRAGLAEAVAGRAVREAVARRRPVGVGSPVAARPAERPLRGGVGR